MSFENSETVGALGAAVAGGLTSTAVNALRKPPAAGGGSSGGGNEGQRPVRTAEQPQAEQSTEQGGTSSAPREAGNNEEAETGAAANAAAELSAIASLRRQMVERQADERRQAQVNSYMSDGMTEEEATERIRREEERERRREERRERRINGAGTSNNRFIGPASRILRTAGGIAGGAMGAAVGLSVGIAQGDIDKALLGITTGATAGFYTGEKLVMGAGGLATGAGHLVQGAGNLLGRLTNGGGPRLQEGSYSHEDMQALMNAGITDEKEIEKIIKNNNGDINKSIEYYRLAKSCPPDIIGDDEKIEDYLRQLGVNPEQAREMRDNIIKYR